MTMDDALPQALRALAADPGSPLLGYSDPDRELVAPVWIWLRSGCADVAESLHRRFGDLVDLKVGFLAFPRSRCSGDAAVAGHAPAPPTWLGVQPVEPVVIPRDRDSTTVTIRLSNCSAQDALIVTGDAAVGHVLDPQTGLIAGGAAGMRNLMALTHELPAGGSVEVPAAFGPASARLRWGYQLPPGEWLGCVDFAFHVGPPDGTRTEVRSSPFPVRIG
ncbi:MAG TPA: hypothetical protein VFM01_12105 [Nakamurella sp.]|nr:hypothetical protein [Nakamurella sp.]